MADCPNLSEALNPEDRRQRDAWLAAFRAHWNERLLDEQVRRLPPPASPLRRALLVGMVKIDLERRRAIGHKPDLDSLLRRYPELNHPDALRALYQTGDTIPPTSGVPDVAPGFLGAEAPAGTMFGKYRLERVLGKGGMGEVWLAHDPVLDRKVAIKRPRNADAALLARLKREAQAVARLDNHPGICRIYELGDVDGQFYLALAYVEGKTLQDVLDKGKPIPPLQAVEVARRLADALAYAHGQNVVHRDLKPANVMLRPGGDPVVMDFGLAGRIDTQHSLTSHGEMVGTPAYMAPEQARGEIASMGPAWDVFGLGAILYEMLAGRRAFDGPTFMGIVYQVQFETPPPPSSLRSEVDSCLDAICRKALAKQASARYPSMKEFKDALEGFLRPDINRKAIGGRPVPLERPPRPVETFTPLPDPEPARNRPRPSRPSRAWTHALPTAGLLVALLALAYFDIGRTPTSLGEPGLVGGFGDAPDLGPLDDPEPLLGIAFEKETQKFGLTILGVKDPENPDLPKRLTSEPNGKNNNTRVKVDGHDYLFGEPGGRVGKWLRPGVRHVRDGRELNVWDAVYRYEGQKVEVTQTVLLVPGVQSRRLDTCLVIYQIVNEDTIPHKVGVRIMLDTFIGANDGVPFAVPGQDGLVESMKELTAREIPDLVQVLELPDLSNPGTVAHVGVKVPGYEAPEKLLICRWPGKYARWDFDPVEAMDKNPEKKDSCVVLYWPDLLMHTGEVRRLAFTYGLSAIATAGFDGRLGLTGGGDFRPGKEFTLAAYVKDPKLGQKVRLTLPRGFELSKGYDKEQAVKGAGAYTLVAWKVRAGPVGRHVLEAESNGAQSRYVVEIREKTPY